MKLRDRCEMNVAQPLRAAPAAVSRPKGLRDERPPAVSQREVRIVIFVVALSATLAAQPRQTSQDEYTLYELLAPETASFKIDYEVTATTPGATSFFNPIRKGSVASDESVFDMMTGAPLKFEQITGEQAKAHGLGNADLQS